VGERQRVRVARERLDQLSLRVEEVECDDLVRLVEGVVDSRGGRRIRTGGTSAAPTAEEATTPIDSIGIARLVQVRALLDDRRRELTKGREVVHDVEAACVRGGDEIALLDRQ